MYTILLFLLLLTIGFIFTSLDISVFLPLITFSLILALLIRSLYLLHSIHNKLVKENKTLSERILEKRKRI
ncbi:hypothetical protein SAMN04487943_101618 [Gracilibacillus orientalis]|uniref:Uncharacterized protein n=1 Tax=Gracilibacillus orientalis TaxID=334253 RepID=A0A1I4HTI3_9BACI|nr:hypothetical protein SAMN04487943_101618 [Gracilibacillus orientalis]